MSSSINATRQSAATQSARSAGRFDGLISLNLQRSLALPRLYRHGDSASYGVFLTRSTGTTGEDIVRRPQAPEAPLLTPRNTQELLSEGWTPADHATLDDEGLEAIEEFSTHINNVIMQAESRRTSPSAPNDQREALDRMLDDISLVSMKEVQHHAIQLGYQCARNERQSHLDSQRLSLHSPTTQVDLEDAQRRVRRLIELEQSVCHTSVDDIAPVFSPAGSLRQILMRPTSKASYDGLLTAKTDSQHRPYERFLTLESFRAMNAALDKGESLACSQETVEIDADVVSAFANWTLGAYPDKYHRDRGSSLPDQDGIDRAADPSRPTAVQQLAQRAQRPGGFDEVLRELGVAQTPRTLPTSRSGNKPTSQATTAGDDTSLPPHSRPPLLSHSQRPDQGTFLESTADERPYTPATRRDASAARKTVSHNTQRPPLQGKWSKKQPPRKPRRVWQDLSKEGLASTSSVEPTSTHPSLSASTHVDYSTKNMDAEHPAALMGSFGTFDTPTRFIALASSPQEHRVDQGYWSEPDSRLFDADLLSDDLPKRCELGPFYGDRGYGEDHWSQAKDDSEQGGRPPGLPIGKIGGTHGSS